VIGLVRADLLKLRRRRGLWAAVLLAPALVTGLAAIGTILSDERLAPVTYGDDVAFAATLVCQLVAVVVGARLGSEEHALGTLRYQVLTGTARARLYGSKLLALVAVCLVMTGVATAGIVFGAALAAIGAGDGVSIPGVAWQLLLGTLTYSAIAFGIGALLRSTGPAITISVFLALGASNVVLLLSLVDDSLRAAAVDVAKERLTLDDADPEDRISLGAAVVSLLAWLALPLAAGFERLRRTEP
jgi:ABC-type transport system involved in multi-copper enzyme maturation permease subunit